MIEFTCPARVRPQITRDPRAVYSITYKYIQYEEGGGDTRTEVIILDADSEPTLAAHP